MHTKCLHNTLKLHYPTLVRVWCSAGEEKQKFAWDLGRESSESTKKSAVKTVCKETSGSWEVFQDPGFMTGTRDFKATRGQDSRSKVCTGSGCRKYSTVSDKKNHCEGMSKIYWKLSNWGKKNSQEKGPMATTASPTCAIFKVKILL